MRFRPRSGMLPPMDSDEAPGNAANSRPPHTDDYLSFTDRELLSGLAQMTEREREISFQRRFLHGQIQLARAELARRLTLDRPLDVDREALAGIERLLDGIDRREDR